MHIHIVVFLGNSHVGGEDDPLFLSPPGPSQCPTFYIYSISEGLSKGVKFRIWLKQQILDSAFILRSICIKAWSIPQGKVEHIHGFFCHVLPGTPWPHISRMIEQYPRKDTQGHPGDLGTSGREQGQWVGWGESLQALSGASKSFSRLHSGADRARCERGLEGSQAAGWGSFNHGQRGLLAAALGLRLAVAHLAL